MKRSTCFKTAIALFSAFVLICLPAAVREAAGEGYTGESSNFNPTLTVPVRDASGNVIGEVTVSLGPGVNAPIPEGMAGRDGAGWRDVGEYEDGNMVGPDAVGNWMVETVWRKRINEVLAALEAQIRARYPDTYLDLNIDLGDVLGALGIPPAGPFSGEQFATDYTGFGGRVDEGIEADTVVETLEGKDMDDVVIPDTEETETSGSS